MAGRKKEWTVERLAKLEWAVYELKKNDNDMSYREACKKLSVTKEWREWTWKTLKRRYLDKKNPVYCLR